MAIDSREKRQSLVGIITGFLAVSPTPNASKDQEWRQETGWGYPGILAGAAAAVEDSAGMDLALWYQMGIGMR